MRRGNLFHFVVVLLIASSCAAAQDMPRKVRGYSVYRANVKTTSGTPERPGPATDAILTFGDPVLREISITGITLEISARITALQQSGKIDFLTFHNFSGNGI